MDLGIKEPLFSSNKEVRDFQAVLHWCKQADLMMADRADANRGSHQKLLSCGRGPSQQYGYS
jgi:hypothetical protein